jgi:hypothetical protein
MDRFETDHSEPYEALNQVFCAWLESKPCQTCMDDCWRDYKSLRCLKFEKWLKAKPQVRKC